MKIRHRHKLAASQAFTLIELLVVITIIAVLSGLALSQFTKTMENARKLQVQTVIKDLRIAITSYQVEYNRYPINPSMLSGSSGEDIPALQTDENSGLVDALTSTQSSATGSGGGSSVNLNPKDIKFIDLPPAKNGQFGLVGAQPPYKLVDLWGQTYRVLLDTNGDKQVENPDLKNSDPSIAQNSINPPPQMLPTEVAIYSVGLDKTAQTKDDITSWRTK